MKTHFCIIMHLMSMSVVRLLHGAEYDQDIQQKKVRDTLEHKIRSAANLEELLQTIHYEDWKLWKCRLKLKALVDSQDTPPSTSSSSSSHRSTRYAAAAYDLEILKAIDEEWQRTLCMPREVVIDVAKELGTNTNIFFKPSCVSVFRCGGCCNEESLSCRNTSVSYVTKTVFEIALSVTYIPQPVYVRIANHTSCKCMSPSVIRRHAPHQAVDSCSQSPKPCPHGQIWHSEACQCLPHPQRRIREDLSPIAELAVCGPYMVFDEDQCECVCRRDCPANQSVNPGNCTCQCSENFETCAKNQKTFDPDSCSCKPERECSAKTCLSGRLNKMKNCHCVKERKLHSSP
ncbi:vascular endothelial growth factor D [Polypterus senegalus]|nr:vascular endothelial growth factor D [Polypterus senegalus]